MTGLESSNQSEICPECKEWTPWIDEDGKLFCTHCELKKTEWKKFLKEYKAICSKYGLVITSCSCCDGTSLSEIDSKDVKDEIKHLTNKVIHGEYNDQVQKT